MRKGHFSKWLIVFLVAYTIYFSERVLRVFEVTGSEPTVLIGTVLGMIVVQLINLASIKKTKIKNGGTYEPRNSNQFNVSDSSNTSNPYGLEERVQETS